MRPAGRPNEGAQPPQCGRGPVALQDPRRKLTLELTPEDRGSTAFFDRRSFDYGCRELILYVANLLKLHTYSSVAQLVRAHGC